MADEKLRLLSLSVRGGPLDGRRHDPDEVVAEILIGSDPDCHLVVDVPGVSPLHARIWADLNESTVYDTHAPAGVWVNDVRVEKQAPLRPGDVLWLGPPGEAPCIESRFAPWVEVLPASLVESGPAAPVLPAGESVVPVDATGALATTAKSTAPTSPDEDPFFVMEGQDAGSVAPPTPPPVAGRPSPAAREPVRPVEPPAVAAPIVAGQSLSPEALVAETISEDWAAVEPEPAPPPRAAPAVASPTAPVAPADVADDFFIADAAAAPSPPAPVVERPLPSTPPPPAHPAPLPDASAPPPSAPPAAPQRFVPEAHPEVPARSRRRSTSPPPPHPGPSPTLRPEAAAAARPASPRRPSAPARPAGRPSRGAPDWIRPVALGAGAVVVVGALAFAALRLLGGGVRLEAIEPARVRVGQRARLSGSGFAVDPSGNTVLFDDREAKVAQASATRLEVEVPDVVAESGAERRVRVVVRRGRRESSPLEVAVFQGPRLHGISPEAALPGEIVLLAGSGWGPGATVRFGAAEATVEEVDAARIRAIVPAAAGPAGTAAPVVVTVGGVESNPAPFVVGHLPLVAAVSPRTAAPGDVVEVSGRGFRADPQANDVRVGGVPALVVSSSADALKVVVPLVGPGDGSRVLEARVPGSPDVGQAELQIASPPDPVGFLFVPEPFGAAPGRAHAVLATGLGPAFVLAASGGRTAAERAVESAGRLNGAAQALRTTLDLNFDAREVDSSPTLGLAGHAEALLEVTAEDAAAYDEDWTGLRGRGGPVTRARLARWWEAVARDIVLLAVRGERPHFTAALAPEGRVLGQLFDAARRTGRPGVPRRVVEEASPSLRDGLRLLALRVPASVAGPAPAAAASPASSAATATPRPAPLALDGSWIGSESEGGRQQYLTVRFRRGGGTIAYEGGITLTVPLLTLEQTARDQARFSVQIRGGVRHYVGKWDGERLAGSVSTDGAGRNLVASFELRKR